MPFFYLFLYYVVLYLIKIARLYRLETTPHLGNISLLVTWCFKNNVENEKNFWSGLHIQTTSCFPGVQRFFDFSSSRLMATLHFFSSVLGLKGTDDPHNLCNPAHSSTEHIIYMIHQYIATCNSGNITISSDAIRESSECITDSTRTPSILENSVGENHLVVIII